MKIKYISLKIVFCFSVLLYSCNRVDNIKVISQDGILISSGRRSMGCPYDSYKDGIYRKYTVIDSLSNKVLAEFVETDSIYGNIRNITSWCYVDVERERLYKNLSNSISDPHIEWYLNRCPDCCGENNKDLINFLLTHQASYKDRLVDRLRYDDYSSFKMVNDSILAVLENSIYSPREYAKLCKVDTFVSMYCKKYKPTYLPYREDSIFPINIVDIKNRKSGYFYKPFFFIYQQSYEAFQQVKANRHKEGYFYKIRNDGFDYKDWHHRRDQTLLSNKIILTEQTILKNNLGQWGYDRRILNPMFYAQRDINPYGYPIYTADLEGLLSLPMTEETIIRAHEESEKIRRQRKE